MRFFRITGSVFCLLSIVLMCLLAASVFNESLAARLKDIGGSTLLTLSEFSEKAAKNAFSESGK